MKPDRKSHVLDDDRFATANIEARRLLIKYGFFDEAYCLSVERENHRYDIKPHNISPVAADLLEENGFSELAIKFREPT